MIVFDLKCGGNHVFEAYFGSSTAYEEQCARGLVCCPLCGDTAITKAAMAPNVAAKSNSLATRAGKRPTPGAVKAAMQVLAAAQTQALEKSTWVGRAFADQARAMHDGDQPAAPIHGQTTPKEAKALIDDGVPVAALPFPVIPAEAIN